jgi:hypothetical protein
MQMEMKSNVQGCRLGERDWDAFLQCKLGISGYPSFQISGVSPSWLEWNNFIYYINTSACYIEFLATEKNRI